MKNKLKSTLLILCIPVVVYLIFRILQPARFGSADGMFILFQQAMMPSVTACGLFFIITMGLWDFSVGANIVLSAIIAVQLYGIIGMPGLILGGIVTGTLVGFVNGITYIKLKIPSIIVSIGMLMFYECLGMLASGGSILTLVAQGRILGKAPWNIVGCVIAFVLAHFLISYTRIGIYIRAVGSNETVVSAMGVDVGKYKMLGFTLCGLFSGIASVLTVSYSSSIAPLLSMESMDRNFLPLMGCFVGLALKKYISPIVAILLGELTISMLISGLMTNGIDATLQNVVIGLTLLVIVGVSARSLRAQKNKEIVVK